jgi:hypothetical protein
VPVHDKDHPVGRCIYCGSTEPPLTDEHVIPEGLGGRELLREASCERCEKTTGRFEQIVMRESAWGLRRALGMRGTKRKLPVVIPARMLHRDGTIKASPAPPSGIWFKGALPIFNDPLGLLTGRAPHVETLVDMMAFIDVEKLPSRGMPNLGLRVDATAFARMLAKIAHAHAVELFGLDEFEAFLPDVILGRHPNLSYLIGCAPIEPPPPEPGVGHRCDLFRQRGEHEGILLGRIRLFAEVGGPVYDVVIGRLREGP